NPDDADALRMLGKLQKHDGDLAGALASLQRSMELKATEETRNQLVSTGLAALGQDFSKFREVVDQLQKLVETTEERLALARLTARGLQAAGQRQEALARYFEF